MISILCIAFHPEIISTLKFKYPQFYRKCVFSEKLVDPNSYNLIVLPVEQFIFLNREMDDKQVIAFGAATHLEEAYCLGVLDYLKNPWDIVELILRVNKILNLEKIHIGQNSIEILSSGIRINERLRKLSKRETRILLLLFNNINQIVAYNTISRFINIQSDNYENSLYVSISKLNKKLYEFAPDVFPDQLKIQNTSGSGYMLRTVCG